MYLVANADLELMSLVAFGSFLQIVKLGAIQAELVDILPVSIHQP